MIPSSYFEQIMGKNMLYSLNYCKMHNFRIKVENVQNAYLNHKLERH